MVPHIYASVFDTVLYLDICINLYRYTAVGGVGAGATGAGAGADAYQS